jgi:hypothetical protein
MSSEHRDNPNTDHINMGIKATVFYGLALAAILIPYERSLCAVDDTRIDKASNIVQNAVAVEHRHWTGQPISLINQKFLIPKGGALNQTRTYNLHIPAAAQNCFWVLLYNVDFDIIERAVEGTFGSGFSQAYTKGFSSESQHVTHSTHEELVKKDGCEPLGFGPFDGEMTLLWDQLYHDDQELLEKDWTPTLRLRVVQIRLTQNELRELKPTSDARLEPGKVRLDIYYYRGSDSQRDRKPVL